MKFHSAHAKKIVALLLLAVTLTLSAAPAYTGDTYLDGGALKIPATWTNQVKTHVAGMSVRKSSETIDDVVYTVYTLGVPRATIFLVR